MSIRLCDWEEIGDDEDVALNQQGDMIALRTESGDTYRVYFDHTKDKAFLVFENKPPESIKGNVFTIINALGYEPVEINEEN
jgi:hypothetical protein